jgi:hypothetical protein
MERRTCQQLPAKAVPSFPFLIGVHRRVDKCARLIAERDRARNAAIDGLIGTALGGLFQRRSRAEVEMAAG